jgi:hypothetical protein
MRNSKQIWEIWNYQGVLPLHSLSIYFLWWIAFHSVAFFSNSLWKWWWWWWWWWWWRKSNKHQKKPEYSLDASKHNFQLFRTPFFLSNSLSTDITFSRSHHIIIYNKASTLHRHIGSPFDRRKIWGMKKRRKHVENVLYVSFSSFLLTLFSCLS